LHKFEVKDNPKVNEDSETIIRKPIINAQIQRSDFGIILQENILGCG